MEDRASASAAQRVCAEVAALAPLSVKDLKAHWRDIYDTEPPSRISRELLTRAIAYRLQESEFGGLDRKTRRLLERVADDLSHDAKRGAPTRKAVPGTLLIREWRGKAHQVTVLSDGVSFRGKRYGSLSAVACLITGTRWSGPLFFGLKSPAGVIRHGAA